MSVFLDATLGSATANSYIDVATADAQMPMVATSDRATAWVALTSDVKATYLIRATRMLETYVDFTGMRVNDYQPLAWPRNFVYGPDRYFMYQSDQLPIRVVEATALVALNLSEGFDQDLAAGAPLDQLQLGSFRAKFASIRSARAATLLPSEAIERLRGFGEYVGSSGFARSIPTERA